jgi:hypothetical protein
VHDRDAVEWWQPEPGTLVQVRVSPECRHPHWKSPNVGRVCRAESSDYFGPHRFYVMSLVEDWQKACWAGYYAAAELEPVSGT